jgi:lipopolysaccharide transport system permease protein/teichoic acid transport system permease protein
VKYLQEIVAFIKSIYINHSLIWDLTKKEFRQRYLGSYLGILWAFIQPTITVFIFWFVFQVGFRVQPTETGVPFVLWLICGMFPWFFFSESLGSATGAIINKPFLVKKIVFEVKILPIIQILAALVIHIFFIIVLFALFLLYGYLPNAYNLQIIYYFFYTICLVLGLSWITSSLSVFSRDIVQLVNMCLQFMFWGTPIFWNINSVPERYIWIIKLNPMYYVVNGYRESFIYNDWFWNHLNEMLYYWIFVVAIMFIGVFIFGRLRPHFADAL